MDIPRVETALSRASVYRRPLRRLAKAYFVTAQVMLSYLVLAWRRRLRSEEDALALVQETHRRNSDQCDKNAPSELKLHGAVQKRRNEQGMSTYDQHQGHEADRRTEGQSLVSD